MVGPRVYKVEQVDRLIPEIESVFAELDLHRKKLRQLSIRANALELIWGEAVQHEDNPDHGEFEQHVLDMQKTKELFEACTGRIEKLGGQVKSVEPPLVDFFGVRAGHLISWCWTQGEKRITHWHHVDEGFSARQPISGAPPA